jgi:hypothetical protein
VSLPFSDQVLDRRSSKHDLDCRASTTTQLRNQLLRHNTFKSVAEQNSDLILLVRWENVDDSVNCRRRISGVKCSEY